ncbi:MAG: hypothetical protein HW387_1397 [Parachlamydiales bacterium]|nr:hypothetical protein [Parachlamydiales bacterium]
MSCTSSENYFRNMVKYYQIKPQDQQQPRNAPPQTIYCNHYRSWEPIFIPCSMGNGGSHQQPVGTAEGVRQARQYQNENSKADRASAAAWLGGIAFIIIAGLAAFVIEDREKINERLKVAKDFKDQIPKSQNIPEAEKDALHSIAEQDIDILEKKSTRNRNILILTGCALATAVTAFAAGMLAVQWLITATIVASVAILAIGAFATVWYCMDNTSNAEENLKANVRQYIREHELPVMGTPINRQQTA